MSVETKNFKPKDVIEYARANQCKYLDMRFMDLPGLWQHYSFPIERLAEDTFENGFGFDGSSIRGWKAINDSDMIVIPDPTTAFIDPFMKDKTLVLIGDIFDPVTNFFFNIFPIS